MPEIVISFDDGYPLDFKAVELFEKHDIQCRKVFYINSIKSGMVPSDIRRLGESVEIGGHTLTHPQDLKLLNEDQLKAEIIDDRKNLQEASGQEVSSFCYPRGRFNDLAKRIVMQAGYKEARTTVVHNTSQGQYPFEIATTIHMYPRQEYRGRSWIDEMKTYLRLAIDKKEQGYFHLWGHSWELEKLGLWNEFEEALEILKENKVA